MQTFIYGKYKYDYELIREGRKTLSLSIKPDLHLTVKAPIEAEKERIEKFLKKKWSWIEKQIIFFKKHRKNNYKKEYISGESIMYLGRQYKLLVKSSKYNKIFLGKKDLYIYTNDLTSNGKNNKTMLYNWLVERGNEVFFERFEQMKKRFDYKKMPKLVIRNMNKRWGSFLNSKKIFLNPKLIHVSTICIDYVIVHELCHMKHKDHSNKFFKFLSSKYPKWEKVKEKLELSTI